MALDTAARRCKLVRARNESRRILALGPRSKKVAATYEKRTAFGFVSSTVNMNGCTYGFNIKGEVEVECPSGKEIEIAVNNGSGCAVKIGKQTKLKSVTYANVVGKNGRNSTEVKIAVKKIKYTSNGKRIRLPGQWPGS